MLAIPQELPEALGLHQTGTVVVSSADDSKLELDTSGPVDVTLNGRRMTTKAVVLPPGAEVLVGQIVLERMDLLVDCQSQTLIARPESPMYPSLKLK